MRAIAARLNRRTLRVGDPWRNRWPGWARKKHWRWPVARGLDHLLPGQCWADLATWAMDTPKEQIERADSLRGLIPGGSNRTCANATGYCWCGKLRPREDQP